MATAYAQQQTRMFLATVKWINRIFIFGLVVNSFWFLVDWQGTLLQNTTGVLIIGIGVACERAVKQGRTQFAIPFYLSFTFVLIAGMMLVAGQAFILNFAAGMYNLILIASFVHEPRRAFRWGFAGSVIYLLALTIRLMISPAALSSAEIIGLYIFPPIMIFLFNGIGRAIALRLSTALEASETARADLEQSNQSLQQLQTALAATNEKLQAELRERARVETELRASEALYRSLINASPDAIVFSDLNGKRRAANQRSAELLGFPNVEAMLDKSVFNFIAPEDQARARENTRRTLEEGLVRNIEYTLHRDDGVHIPIELSAAVVRDTEGKPQGFVGIVQDITLRKRAEEELRASEALYRSLIDASPDSVVFADLEGKVVAANRPAAAITGYPSPEAMIGASTFDFIVPAERARALENARKVFEQGSLSNTPYTLLRLDGTTCPGEISVALVRDAAGKPRGFIGITHDITERKRAEDELRESEANLARAQAIGHIANWDVTLADNRWDWSPELPRIFGIPPDELDFRKSLDSIHPDDRDRAVQALTEAMQNIKPLNIDFRIVRPDGGVRYVHDEGELMLDESGKPVKLFGITQDITERKLAEEMLRQSEADLKRAQTVAHVGSWYNDLTTNALTWSDETYRMFGVPFGTPMSYETFLNCVHPDDRAKLERAWAKTLTDGDLYDLEHRIVIGDEIRWVRERAEIEVDAHGNHVRGIGTVQDITERRQMETALRESEERFRVAAQSTSELIWEWNVAENRLEWYGPIDQMLGYAPGEFSRTIVGWENSIHPDDRAAVLTLLDEHLKTGKLFTTEYCVVCKDGTLCYWKDRGFALRDAEGKPYKMIGACSDISQRKQQEAQIATSLREKETLLKEIHHRVKNNLQIISSLLNLQAQHVRDPFAAQMLQDSQNRVRSMALVHERLYRSADIARVNFDEYLEELTVQLSRAYPAGKLVQFFIHAPGIQLDADTAVPCGLIVNELVSNALKHGFPETHRAAKPQVSVSFTCQDERTFDLQVRDNGVGLPPAFALGKSSALGLQLVNGLARQLNGTFEFASDAGAQFSVRFPAQRE